MRFLSSQEIEKRSSKKTHHEQLKMRTNNRSRTVLEEVKKQVRDAARCDDAYQSIVSSAASISAAVANAAMLCSACST